MFIACVISISMLYFDGSAHVSRILEKMRRASETVIQKSPQENPRRWNHILLWSQTRDVFLAKIHFSFPEIIALISRVFFYPEWLSWLFVYEKRRKKGRSKSTLKTFEKIDVCYLIWWRIPQPVINQWKNKTVSKRIVDSYGDTCAEDFYRHIHVSWIIRWINSQMDYCLSENWKANVRIRENCVRRNLKRCRFCC